ncbi:MAG TPA: phosphotransferase family protein [Sporichthyaceae bacterium]|nr:phosphotransferase family protein [Sporichthyaceae bacterium]
MDSVAEWSAAAVVWLTEALPGTGEVRLEPIVAGHSNIVLAAHRGPDSYIVRRPPFGHFAASAHDVLREARLLTVLEQVGATRTPRVAAMAEDPPGPAYAMTRLPGHAIRQTEPAWLTTPAQRSTIATSLVETLAELHRLPTAPFEAAGLGRTGGYLTRQLKRWSGQRDEFVAAGVRPLADEPAVREWLFAHAPEERASTLVHGDYKLDNVLVDEQTCTVTGVLDWEMATLGDPLADLGFLLAFWPDSREAVDSFELLGDVTLHEGYPDRAGMVDAYAKAIGQPIALADVTWYQVLAMWKMALLLEASYTRFLAGTTDDEFFARLDTAIPRLLAATRDLSAALDPTGA